MIIYLKRKSISEVPFLHEIFIRANWQQILNEGSHVQMGTNAWACLLPLSFKLQMVRWHLFILPKHNDHQDA